MNANEQARKLRLVESAAASAVLNGCDPDEVRRRVEIGIAEALDSNARLAASRAAIAEADRRAAQTDPSAGGVLADWARSVGA